MLGGDLSQCSGERPLHHHLPASAVSSPQFRALGAFKAPARWFHQKDQGIVCTMLQGDTQKSLSPPHEVSRLGARPGSEGGHGMGLVRDSLPGPLPCDFELDPSGLRFLSIQNGGRESTTWHWSCWSSEKTHANLLLQHLAPGRSGLCHWLPLMVFLSRSHELSKGTVGFLPKLQSQDSSRDGYHRRASQMLTPEQPRVE